MCFFKFPTFPPFSSPISRLRRETGHVPPRQARVPAVRAAATGRGAGQGLSRSFRDPKGTADYLWLSTIKHDD